MPYDAIVIGAGGVGTAALASLARRGLRVLGLDRFPPGHDRGSSHGDTRLIRQAYYEDPNYVPLLQRAYTLWHELEELVQQRLYFPVGVLQAGPPDGELVPGVRASAKLHGLKIEELSHTDLGRRFPGFRLPEPLEAVFEPHAGYLRVEECVLAHAKAAERAGAEIRSGVTVHSWSASPAGVRVATSAGEFEARGLIITAGAWAADVLQSLQIPLKVVRKSLYWFTPRTARYRPEAGGTGFIYETRRNPAAAHPGEDGEFYGFPQIDSWGVKAAEHSGGLPVADPLDVDRREFAFETERVVNFLASCLPDVAPQVTRFKTCLYTRTPDCHFVVDRHPDYPHVAFAAGLSGHGFKFTPVLGEILADWIADGKTSQPVSFLNLKRFARR